MSISEASTAGQKRTMKAVVCPRYGSPDVLELQEVDKPVLTDDRVLVRVKAASVNPADRYAIKGPFIVRFSEGLLRPKRKIQGADLAGTVAAVGRNVTQFQPGDEVFGTGPGSFAEYVCAREDRLVLKPGRITFEQAAAVPIAAITALQGLRDKGHIRPGQKVLINGASGGVGTFSLQIAKSFGAEVTGVCSTRNFDLARSLGADKVIDYTRDDFIHDGNQFDLVLENVGNRSLSDCRRVLVHNGTLVLVGADSRRGFFFVRLIARLIKAKLLSWLTSEKVVFFIAQINKGDLVFLKELIEAGKVTPVIDRRYSLNEVPEAIKYLGEGHARGKVVITI